MHTQSVTLEYLPQYKAYGISDEKINVFEKQNIIPLISLAPQDIDSLPTRLKITNRLLLFCWDAMKITILLTTTTPALFYNPA